MSEISVGLADWEVGYLAEILRSEMVRAHSCALMPIFTVAEHEQQLARAARLENLRDKILAARAPDVVGLDEIARRLGVLPATARTWRHRKLMPEPLWIISDRPAWLWSDILIWAEATNRMPPDQPEWS